MSTTQNATRKLNRNQRGALLHIKAKQGAYVHYATALALARRGLVSYDLDPDAGPSVLYCELTGAGYTEALHLQGY